MTLIELYNEIINLMADENNHNKDVMGDIKPGLIVKGIKPYGNHYIAIFDEREVEAK